MRCLRYFLTVLLTTGVAAQAQEKTTQLAIDLDWSNVIEQQKLASILQEKGALPLLLIFVNGALNGMLPTQVDVPSNASDTRIDIGMPQFAERPIYSLRLGPETNGQMPIQIEYPELGAVYDYEMPTGSTQDTLSIKRIIKSQTSTVYQDGKRTLTLPAEPYAVITAFAAKVKGGLPAIGLIPVVAIADGTQYPPTEFFLQKYGFDITKFIDAEGPSIYKTNVITSWATKWIQDPFRAPPQDDLRLTSVPAQASIYINGYDQSRSTETVIRTPKNLWRTIVLRKKGYADCPFDETKLTPGAIPSFSCSLRKR